MLVGADRDGYVAREARDRAPLRILRGDLHRGRDGGPGGGVTRLHGEHQLRARQGDPEIGLGFRIASERRPCARVARLIHRPSLPVIGRVVAEPRDGRGRAAAARHRAAGSARRSGERRADRLDFDLEPQLAAGRVRHASAEHHRPTGRRPADGDRGTAVALELRQRGGEVWRGRGGRLDHELDGNARRAAHRLPSGDDHCVAIHTWGKPGGVELEVQPRRRGPRHRGDVEPRAVRGGPRGPHQRARPGVREREAVALHRGAARGGGVEHTPRRDGERGGGRWSVGELIELAGDADEGQRARGGPQRRTAGAGPAPRSVGSLRWAHKK